MKNKPQILTIQQFADEIKKNLKEELIDGAILDAKITTDYAFDIDNLSLSKEINSVYLTIHGGLSCSGINESLDDLFKEMLSNMKNLGWSRYA